MVIAPASALRWRASAAIILSLRKIEWNRGVWRCCSGSRPVTVHSCVGPLGAAAVASRNGDGQFDRRVRVGIRDDEAGLESARLHPARAREMVELIRKEKMRGLQPACRTFSPQTPYPLLSMGESGVRVYCGCKSFMLSHCLSRHSGMWFSRYGILRTEKLCPSQNDVRFNRINLVLAPFSAGCTTAGRFRPG